MCCDLCNPRVLTARCYVDLFDIRARSKGNDAKLVSGEHLDERLGDGQENGRLRIQQHDTCPVLESSDPSMQIKITH
jgi:hypothetical protein